MTVCRPTGRERWLASSIALALSAVTLLVYWPARRFDLLNWDDLTYVSTNDHVRGGLTWNAFLWSFTHSYWSNWHPLTWLSHALDCQLYGLNPGGHHLTSLLLHSANAGLLFLVLRRLTGALWRSALVAALFALHPLHVESVAWVAERKDVLSAFFFMLTLWAYCCYAEGRAQKSEGRRPKAERRPKPEARNPKPEAGGPSTLRSSVHPPQCYGGRATEDGWPLSHLPSSIFYLLSLSLFALGLMSKPMLVTVPFVLLLLDYWPLGRMQNAECRMQNVAPPDTPHASRLTPHASRLTAQSQIANRKSQIIFPLILEKLPFFALSASSCIITFLAQKTGGAVNSFAMLSLDARLANAAVAYLQYLAKFFWPADLSPIYPYPDRWGPWLVTGAAAVLVLLTATVWRGRRRFPYALMGWLWYLGMLVPVIGIVQVGSQAFADRYTYLPLVGIMVALVWLGAESIGKGLRRSDRPSPALKGSLSPSEGEREGVRGLTLIPRPVPIQACGSGVPGILPAVLSLALLATLAWCTREQLPTWKDTGALYRHALALNPNNVQALYGLGAHLVDSGHFDEGKRLLEEATRLRPAYPEALGTLASTLDGQGKYEEAIGFYRAALKAQPDQDGILNNLAWLLASCPDAALRNGPEAVRLATRACELTGYAKPLLIGTLAAAQAEVGDFQAAITTAERAAALATALRLEEVAAKDRELIQLYRQGQPFHEKKGGE
jgi:Tfp pilus assembly protein PilF